MGDGINTPLSIDDFIPVVGKNYIQPHIVQIPNGAYYPLTYKRAVLLIPQTPTTSGTVYIFPGAYPVNDLSSIPIPSGNNVYLDARGDWYVKTSSSGTEKFLVIDAGAAGNAAAIASSFGTTPASATANRGAFFTTQKNVTTAGTPVNCSAQAIPNGFALSIKAKSSNTQKIYVGNSSANALSSNNVAYILSPGETARLFVTNANLIWLDSDVNGEGVCLGAEV